MPPRERDDIDDLDLDEARFGKELAKTSAWLDAHGPIVRSLLKDPRPGGVAQTPGGHSGILGGP